MFNVRVDQSDLRQLEQQPARLRRGFRAITAGIAARAAVELRHDAPKASSNMANSIRHFSTDTGAEVLVAANYAVFAHDGRASGGVDPFALADWARSKGKTAQDGFAIARNIQRHGTKAKPFVKDFVESSRFVAIRNRVIERELARTA